MKCQSIVISNEKGKECTYECVQEKGHEGLHYTYKPDTKHTIPFRYWTDENSTECFLRLLK